MHPQNASLINTLYAYAHLSLHRPLDGCEVLRYAYLPVCPSVCLHIGPYVCLFFYPLAYVKNHMSKPHQNFCGCCLWLWLGPPLTTMQYVT